MALTAYSKYRIYVTRTATSPAGKPIYVTIHTFSGFGNGDGSGTDLFVGGTASAKSTYVSAVPSRAFDGNPGTTYSSQSEAAPQWLRIDLASPVVVRCFYLGAATSANETPRDFIIQGSNDGTNWTDLYEVVDWVTTSSGKNESFRIDLSLDGVSMLDTGGGASKIFVNRFDNGQFVGVAVPDAVTGAWSMKLQYAGDVLVTHIGPSGYRPMTDGPVTPIAE
jgi:hypothetical protein